MTERTILKKPTFSSSWLHSFKMVEVTPAGGLSLLTRGVATTVAAWEADGGESLFLGPAVLQVRAATRGVLLRRNELQNRTLAAPYDINLVLVFCLVLLLASALSSFFLQLVFTLSPTLCWIRSIFVRNLLLTCFLSCHVLHVLLPTDSAASEVSQRKHSLLWVRACDKRNGVEEELDLIY